MDIYIGRIPIEAMWMWTLAAVAAGVWRGGTAGRIISAILIGQLFRSTFWDVSFFETLIVDTLTLAICLALVLYGRSYWTIWAAASAFLSVVTNGLRIAIPDLTPWSYYSAQVALFLALGGIVFVGPLLSPGQRPARRRA